MLGLTQPESSPKMLKKLLAAVTTLALAVGMVAATAGTASAHTPNVTSTCSTLTLDLTNYADTVVGVEGSPGSLAVYETVTVIDNLESRVHHEAVADTYTHYSYTPHGDAREPLTSSTPVEDSNHWQADNKKKTGNDLLGQAFQQGNGVNSSWFFWLSNNDGKDGYYETIPAITHTEQKQVKEAIEPVEAVAGHTNTVKVVIDGAAVEDTTFGTTFKKSYEYTDSAVAHDYTVTVVAWDDSNYSFTQSGTSVPCHVPPVQPEAIVTHSPVSTSDCEAKTVTTVDTISTTTFVLNESETEYIKGTPVITSETSTREMTDAEVAECPVIVPVQPESTVSTRSVSVATIHCATSTVNTVTAHYSTTTTYVYNSESNSYDAVVGAEVRGEDTSSSRAATLGECPVIVPGKPGPVVTNTSSTTVDCGTTIVTTRSSTTTVDYKLVSNVWVKQAPVTVQDPDITRAATDAECHVTTFALVTPVVTSVDRTCTVNGSYSLGVVDGVIYTVNGTVQQPGTYQVSTAKTVNVVASLTSADFGFEQGVEAVRNLTFTDPKNCGELATLALPGSNGTLAFTGSNGTLAGGLLLGLIFMIFGAGAMTVNRVRRRTN